MITRKTKIWLINSCILFACWLDFGGPRDLYEAMAGGVHNPQYLFADSEFPLCKRVRRIVNNDGKVDIFIENISTHHLLIYYTNERLRNVIALCHKYRELGWELKD